MPAKSKAQQKAAGAALSAKRGETKRSALKGASKQMYDSMSETQLDEFASTKRKGKPDYTPDSPIPMLWTALHPAGSVSFRFEPEKSHEPGSYDRIGYREVGVPASRR